MRLMKIDVLHLGDACNAKYRALLQIPVLCFVLTQSHAQSTGAPFIESAYTSNSLFANNLFDGTPIEKIIDMDEVLSNALHQRYSRKLNSDFWIQCSYDFGDIDFSPLHVDGRSYTDFEGSLKDIGKEIGCEEFSLCEIPDNVLHVMYFRYMYDRCLWEIEELGSLYHGGVNNEVHLTEQEVAEYVLVACFMGLDFVSVLLDAHGYSSISNEFNLCKTIVDGIPFDSGGWLDNAPFYHDVFKDREPTLKDWKSFIQGEGRDQWRFPMKRSGSRVSFAQLMKFLDVCIEHILLIHK